VTTESLGAASRTTRAVLLVVVLLMMRAIRTGPVSVTNSPTSGAKNVLVGVSLKSVEFPEKNGGSGFPLLTFLMMMLGDEKLLFGASSSTSPVKLATPAYSTRIQSPPAKTYRGVEF